jgi:hypothetical protein
MNERRRQFVARRAAEIKTYKVAGNKRTLLSGGTTIAVNPGKAAAAQRKLRPVITSDDDEQL